MSAASKAADIESSLVTEFRRHLKTCSKLPESIAPSDRLRITLRVIMTLDGRLAADPILIEASASAKGPALMQGAIAALEACQPYAMLPADRYGEWKVLDLSLHAAGFFGLATDVARCLAPHRPPGVRGELPAPGDDHDRGGRHETAPTD